METSFRKVVFKFSLFLLLLGVSLLFVVDPASAQFVVVVLSLGINAVLCAAILFLTWVEKNNRESD